MQLMNEPAANVALAAARAVLAEKGRSFFWASHLLGKKHAGRATRLYAFCRYLDDLADEASSPEDARLALSHARESIVTGETSDPILEDGIDLMKECGILPAVVLELICGITSDLETVRMTDEADLIRYCYRVAGTVGLMMCCVLDTKNPLALAHAVDLGIAMQITNICRDVAEDARLGRRYLPASLVGDVSPDQLIWPSTILQPILIKSLAHLLDKADQFYQSGELGLPYLPLRARSGILVAASIYQAIGIRLAQRNFAYWAGRASVSDWQKFGISLHELATKPFQLDFWKCHTAHRVNLHVALKGLPGIVNQDAT